MVNRIARYFDRPEPAPAPQEQPAALVYNLALPGDPPRPFLLIGDVFTDLSTGRHYHPLTEDDAR